MQQLAQRLRPITGHHLRDPQEPLRVLIRRAPLPPEQSAKLIEEIESLKKTGLVFPADVPAELVETPLLLAESSSLENPKNYRGQRDAFGGRQPPLPSEGVEEWRARNGVEGGLERVGATKC